MAAGAGHGAGRMEARDVVQGFLRRAGGVGELGSRWAARRRSMYGGMMEQCM